MNELESGLRILARIIARTYLEELSQVPNQTKPLEENVEENNANKRNI
jgi:hypothetical protein